LLFPYLHPTHLPAFVSTSEERETQRPVSDRCAFRFLAIWNRPSRRKKFVGGGDGKTIRWQQFLPSKVALHIVGNVIWDSDGL
jgi:hypothetical protein